MKDILGIQYKGVDKQQLSIRSISNSHFMFPLYGDQAQNISVLI